MIDIPNLKIDRDGTDPDTCVMLEQDDGCGNVSYVYLHPVQIRLLAERMGMLPPSSNIDTDRTIRRMSRQMRLLFQRIDQLDDWLNQASQRRGHEDLSMETTYSFASWEMASEFVKELEVDEQERANTPENRSVPGGNTPEFGAVSLGNPPKNGTVSAGNPPKKGAVAGQGQLPLATSEVRS